MTNDTTKALPTLTDAPELPPILQRLCGVHPSIIEDAIRAYGQRCYDAGIAATTREAVAWQYRKKGADYWLFTIHEETRLSAEQNDYEVRALYAAPTAPHDTEGLAPADALVASSDIKQLIRDGCDAVTNQETCKALGLLHEVENWIHAALATPPIIAPAIVEGAAVYSGAFDAALMTASQQRKFLAALFQSNAVTALDREAEAFQLGRDLEKETIAQARRDALEEAAKVLDGEKYQHRSWADNETIRMCASVVRSLASPPAAQSDREGA